MAEALAKFQSRAQALAGEVAFAEPQVGEPTEVETIGLSPGVLAIRVFGTVERVAGVLEGLPCVTSREERFGRTRAAPIRVQEAFDLVLLPGPPYRCLLA